MRKQLWSVYRARTHAAHTKRKIAKSNDGVNVTLWWTMSVRSFVSVPHAVQNIQLKTATTARSSFARFAWERVWLMRSAWSNVKPKSIAIIHGERKFITHYSRIAREHTPISICRLNIGTWNEYIACGVASIEWDAINFENELENRTLVAPHGANIQIHYRLFYWPKRFLVKSPNNVKWRKSIVIEFELVV